MPSYSEWLGRQLQREQKFLDTRPHRTASHHTEVIKRAATAVIDRRPTGLKVLPASAFTDYRGGVAFRTAERAAPSPASSAQLTIRCATVAEPPPPVYTNPRVLEGLGKAKLANCCVTCGVTNDAGPCPCGPRR